MGLALLPFAEEGFGFGLRRAGGGPWGISGLGLATVASAGENGRRAGDAAALGNRDAAGAAPLPAQFEAEAIACSLS
jgi:hypothetical protein